MNTNLMTFLKNICLISWGLFGCSSETKETSKIENTATTNELPFYEGTDLGLTYSPEKSIFKLWSPKAEAVQLHFYQHDLGGKSIRTENLKKSEKGIWKIEIHEDLEGLYYTFQVKFKGKILEETSGIYAKAVGTNGQRAMVVDLAKTNPKGWQNDQRPDLKQFTDIILYEMHIRDFTIHESSGAKNRGKFLGVIEENLTNSLGQKTGLDHLKELGITHVHLLPVFDFQSIDESKLDSAQFNWGYDPQNYNTPEGSYSTNPADGAVRIREFKQLVKKLHESGIRVIMDVVYNHTALTPNSNFNLEFPHYYYRLNKDKSFSNASGCGNETASERPMMRKFILESVKYWVEEYHIDGFRFDLMGIHDLETMNEISTELQKMDSTIFIYGEGWTAGASLLPDSVRALKNNTLQLKNIAVFSDDIRDAIKGHWSNETDKGFVNGITNFSESIKFGIAGATQHPQIQYKKVNYSKTPWAKHPAQTINYVACHDNQTLYDKLKTTDRHASEEKILKMHRLANTIVFTSQGVPFLHAGAEFARTKFGEHNSYKSPDSINQIDWNRKEKYQNLVEYYQNLIRLRKKYPAFRLVSNELIQKHLQFLPEQPQGIVAYLLTDYAGGGDVKQILVVLNGKEAKQKINLPKGDWEVLLKNEQFSLEGGEKFQGGETEISGISALILMEKS